VPRQLRLTHSKLCGVSSSTWYEVIHKILTVALSAHLSPFLLNQTLEAQPSNRVEPLRGLSSCVEFVFENRDRMVDAHIMTGASPLV